MNGKARTQAGRAGGALPMVSDFSYLTMIVHMGIMRILVRQRAFDIIPKDGTTTTIDDLAQRCEMEPGLLRRFCACLIANGVLSSPTKDQIAHTETSRQYCSDGHATLLLVHTFDHLLVPIAHWPGFFAPGTLLHEPKQARHTPLSHALGHPDKSIYEILEMMPERSEIFNRTMQMAMQTMPITGMYDFSWVKAADDERTLLVDVGGAKGQALQAILAENRNIPPSRCILQDRAEVITEATQSCNDGLLQPVQKMANSFFDGQPIKGALIYHIRRVLNDWPDGDCVTILRHIRAACADDSRVLVSEQLLPEEPSAMMLALDIFFLNVGGKRRTAQMYCDLAVQAGFRVETISEDSGGSGTSVIEMVPMTTD